MCCVCMCVHVYVGETCVLKESSPGLLAPCPNRTPVQEKVPLSPTELLVTHADITLSQQVLHFSPRISIKEGLHLFVEWFKDYTHNTSSLEEEQEQNRRKADEILRCNPCPS